MAMFLKAQTLSHVVSTETFSRVKLPLPPAALNEKTAGSKKDEAASDILVLISVTSRRTTVASANAAIIM